MTRTCPSCVAWRSWGSQRVSRGGGPVTDEPVGQCRARPPTIDPESFSGTNASWPVVGSDDWCLEYRSTHQNLVARSGAAPSSSRHEGREA